MSLEHQMPTLQKWPSGRRRTDPVVSSDSCQCTRNLIILIFRGSTAAKRSLTSMMNRLSFTSAEIRKLEEVQHVGSVLKMEYMVLYCYTKTIKFGRLWKVKAFSCRHPLPLAYWDVILFQKIPSVPVPAVILLTNLINSDIFAQWGWFLVIWSWISICQVSQTVPGLTRWPWTVRWPRGSGSLWAPQKSGFQ